MSSPSPRINPARGGCAVGAGIASLRGVSEPDPLHEFSPEESAALSSTEVMVLTVSVVLIVVTALFVLV
jgi:hypothetical protein